MSLWRYVAIENAPPRARRSGELAGETAAEVRAALRRIGLQAIEVRPLSAPQHADRDAAGGGSLLAIRAALRARLHAHLCRRRRAAKAELYDGLSTMLVSGVPLMEAIEAITASVRGPRSALRLMLVALRQGLRSGASMAASMREQRRWFEPAETAMVEAAEHSGTLPEVLRSLSDRHERSGELGHRLASALAYPCIVSIVGLGVVIFLAVKPLPSLAGVLADAGLELPALTRHVMHLGAFLAHWWWALGVGLAIPAAAAIVAAPLAGRAGLQAPGWMRHLSPALLRRMAVSRLALQLAEMLRSGVPMVEALRVLAPTTGAASRGLGRELLAAAERVERGEELSAALHNEHWFDAEFRRILDIGQASGDLDKLLERIGLRYARRATRLIDRLSALLEPCVILTLASLIGIVVMAAVLPLLRLQEALW